MRYDPPCDLPTKHYRLTGTDARGRRFGINSDDFFFLRHHNVYRGTLWVVFDNGTRRKLKTWWN